MKKKSRILISQLFLLAFFLILTFSCEKDPTKKDPVITWANPADIVYGTLLSATQLNATADVPGNFVYTPAIGVKLEVGDNQDLTVDFIPTDIENYNTASKTVKINVTAPTTSTVTDYDGNVYNTVVIGTQVWMKENLKTTHYNDGSDIPNITDAEAWVTQIAGAYCNYNNSSANGTTYGALYNWNAVKTGKLCPTGWHVPSDAEWKTLIDFLGGESVAGGKLKSITGWNTPNTGATNENGFTALPGAGRMDNGAFYSLGDLGVWWSSTEFNTEGAWTRYLVNTNAIVGRGEGDKVDGFSIRCLKD
ncbi:hypothetical protein CYCD_21860 [Tenuifilaceae bacterium CYCD]|nr:hypothetical protein CYCD_21860 [Tenuifilaceae bacterium CYCD]